MDLDTLLLGYMGGFHLSADGQTVAYFSIDGDLGITPVLWTADSTEAFSTLDGYSSFNLSGISGDGRTIMGVGFHWNGTDGLVWQDGGEPINVGHLDGNYPVTVLERISRDGTVVVGYSHVGETPRAVRWSGSELEELDDLDADHSHAHYVSADGSVIAGYISTALLLQTVIWHDGVPTVISELDENGILAGLSSDGSTLIGKLNFEFQVSAAFRWRDGIFLKLGTLGGPTSEALGVSGDGAIVIGNATVDEDGYITRAFRWTEAEGMVDLGSLQDVSEANAISDDGRVIVGRSQHPTLFFVATRWTDAFGMQTIEEILNEGGVGTTGLRFDNSYAVSADGSTIMGIGRDADEQGMVWVARCDEDCTVLSDIDQAQSIAGLGQIGEAGNLYLDLTFHQLGHTLGADSEGTRLTLSGVHDSDPVGTAFAALSHRNADGFEAAVSLGAAVIDTPMPHDGQSMMYGAALSGSVGHRAATGFDWRASAGVLGFAGSIERGYHNGSDPAHSTGETGGYSAAGEIELGWRLGDAATSLRPYAGASLAATAIAGYTETGGPFPATIGDIETITALFRAGIEATHRLENGIVLEAGAALVHRETSGADIAADIPGAFNIAVPGATGPQQWAELELGASVPFGALTLDTNTLLRLPHSGEMSFVSGVGFSLPL